MALRWLWWRAWFPFGAVVAAAAWQARHLATAIFTLRGRRGTWRHGPSLCMAGMALGIDVHSAWQACHFGTGLALVARLVPVWPFAWQAWYLATSTFTLRGRRGTWRHRPSLCVAGMALCDIDRHFVWQARPSLCVAGVECCTMHLCISMYLYVSLCISMYLYVSLCISMYLYVSLCISM